MVTEQMKTDAQRFGNGKKGYNIKQVAELLENAGGGYTAGTGISISEEKAISVDSTVVALKSDIPKEFEQYTDNDWTIFIDDNNIVKEDLCFVISSDINYNRKSNDMFYIPKGVKLDAQAITYIKYTSSISPDNKFALAYIPPAELFNNRNYVSASDNTMIEMFGISNYVIIKINDAGSTSIQKYLTTTPATNNYIVLYRRKVE